MVKKDSVWGLIDDKAQIIVPPQYDKLNYFRGYAYVEKNNQSGMLDKNGKVIIPLKYDSIFRISKDSIRVFKYGTPMLMNAKGKVIR